MGNKTNAFIGAMKRSKKGKRALTPPTDTIQTHPTAPPLVPTEATELHHPEGIVMLVQMLARRAAEHDFREQLRQSKRPNTCEE